MKVYISNALLGWYSHQMLNYDYLYYQMNDVWADTMHSPHGGTPGYQQNKEDLIQNLKQYCPIAVIQN